MNFKRVFALLLVLCVVLLAGCGAQSALKGNGAAMDMSESETGEIGYEPERAGTQSAPLPTNQKLIRKIWITAETEALDALVTHVEEKIGALGGYVEVREVNNYNSYNRRADLTIRIPAQKLDQFTQAVRENANITSTSETAEDITLSYVAVESRVKALETEQSRLLELLAKAENMEEILLIEERLTKVRTELEEVTSQLRVYDNQVSYGTVYLTMREVREYTEEEPEGFFARIGRGLSQSVEDIGDGFVEVVIFLIVASPYLALLALAVGAVALIVKRCKKKAAKKEKKEE